MNTQNYSYPLDPSWSTAEMEQVIAMLRAVEDAYEIGISRDEVLNRYRKFKKIVSSKSEEKKIGNEFEKSSGYILYRVVKEAQNTTNKKIKMTGKEK